MQDLSQEEAKEGGAQEPFEVDGVPIVSAADAMVAAAATAAAAGLTPEAAAAAVAAVQAAGLPRTAGGHGGLRRVGWGLG